MSSEIKCLIYYTSIDEICWEQIKENLNSLSIKDRDKILSIKTERDKCASLIGRLLLSNIIENNNLSNHYNLRDIEFSIHGRPYLKKSDFDFNISHAGTIVACGYISKGFIGVDVEKIAPININEYHSVLSMKEMRGLKTKNGYNINQFYKIWTIKESVIKADGIGFSHDLRSIVIQDKYSILEGNKWFNYTFNLEEGYYLTIATKDKSYPFLQYINIKTII